MKFITSFSAIISAIPYVLATNYYHQPQHHLVEVGVNQDLVYHPSYIWAKAGDVVTFKFNPKNHTVTQSSFNEPCSPLAGGFATGFVPVAPGAASIERTFTVTDEKPQWFYCGQVNHCPSGMVFAINPADKFNEFLAKAKKTGKQPTYEPTYEPAYKPEEKHDDYKPEEKHDDYKPEYKPEEKHDDYKPEYTPAYKPEEKHDDYKAEEKHDDYKPVYRRDDYQPAYKSDYQPEVKHDDYKPEYKPEYTPAYKPEEKHDDYTPAYKPEEKHDDYTPEYTPAYKPEYKPEHKEIYVNVGPDMKLIYDNANIKANVGDKVVFKFFPKNHTVTQSSFEHPCQPLDGGFKSGFMPVGADVKAADQPTFIVEVKDTKPIWGYCGQVNHCASGMVFAINADDNSPNSFKAFQELAKKTVSPAPYRRSAKWRRVSNGL